MEITYLGHSCFILAINGFEILFDPFISPTRLASDIDISKFESDFAPLSPGLSEHIAATELVYKNSTAQSVWGYELTNSFENKDLDTEHEMNLGGSRKFPSGKMEIANVVPSDYLSYKSSEENPTAVGFQAIENSFYRAGATALYEDKKDVEDYFSIDFTILPTGKKFTMGIEDTVIAADDANTNRIAVMHYNTFPYIKPDHQRARKVVSHRRKGLLLMQIGEKANI